MTPPDDFAYRKILARCGVALIIVGLLDIGYMIWCIVHMQSYSSSLNIFAVIAGIFLCRGGLRAAKTVAVFSSFLLTAAVGGFIVAPLVQPIGYWLAVFRHSYGGLAGLAVAVVLVLFLYWIRSQLYGAVVAEAQIQAAIGRPSVMTPIVIGIILIVIILVAQKLMFGGETEREATSRAQQQLGPGYHYVVTSVRTVWSGKKKSVSASVAAYNDSELKAIRVSWER